MSDDVDDDDYDDDEDDDDRYARFKSSSHVLVHFSLSPSLSLSLFKKLLVRRTLFATAACMDGQTLDIRDGVIDAPEAWEGEADAWCSKVEQLAKKVDLLSNK